MKVRRTLKSPRRVIPVLPTILLYVLDSQEIRQPLMLSTGVIESLAVRPNVTAIHECLSDKEDICDPPGDEPECSGDVGGEGVELELVSSDVRYSGDCLCALSSHTKALSSPHSSSKASMV